MVYLDPIRLTFAGRFQADVSTVNNDVRHYDNTSFEPAYQRLQTTKRLNGWWNPTGSGAFRFVEVRVKSLSPGSVDPATASTDPVAEATVAGAGDLTAAKLVDIDPQWQLASAPWGLRVRLLAGDRELLSGDYRPACFRDLWFSRLVGSGGDAAASSTFQSVLENVRFDPDVDSPMLAALREATTGDRLSIRLTTFGYDGSATSPTFTLGHLVGTIGPYREGEPTSVVLGRRFAPAAGMSSWAGITYFSGVVDEAASLLLLDLSNALSLRKASGTLVDIGPLSVVACVDPSIEENTPVTFLDAGAVPDGSPDAAQSTGVVLLGDIDYRVRHWLDTTGGVVAVPLDEAQRRLVQERPLALVTRMPFDPGASGVDDGHGVIAIRETTDGLQVTAEPLVHRVDAPGDTTVRIRAARYGQPLPDRAIAVRQVGRVPGQGGSGRPKQDGPDLATVAIPDIGWPEAALTVPDQVTTGGDGSAELTVTAGDPGNPREYLDGQVYLLDYRLPGQGNAARQPFDFVVLHVRQAYDVPEQPTWADIEPILTQYGNLYPIMSKRLVRLSHRTSVAANRQLLELAFSRDLADPNHMPVTRDLSAGKRATILAWLRGLDDTPEAHPAPSHDATAGDSGGSMPGPDADSPEARTGVADSKSHAAQGFLRALRRPWS